MKRDHAVEVSTVRKVRVNKQGREFLPHALAATDKDLFVHSWWLLYRRETGGKLTDVGVPHTVADYREVLVADGTHLYVGGNAGVAVSEDAGLSFTPLPIRCEGSIVAIAPEAGGGLWVGGGYHGAGELFFRASPASPFVAVSGPTDMVTCMTPTPSGVFVGDRSGAVWFARSGAVEERGHCHTELIDLLETNRGTLLALAGAREDWQDFCLLRSTDGGRTLASHPLKEPLDLLVTLVQLQNGAIVAGGYNSAIGISFDDGISFESVAHSEGAPKQDFTCSCAQGPSAFLSAAYNNLIEVRIAGPS